MRHELCLMDKTFFNHNYNICLICRKCGPQCEKTLFSCMQISKTLISLHCTSAQSSQRLCYQNNPPPQKKVTSFILYFFRSDGKEHYFTAENHESMMIWLLGLQVGFISFIMANNFSCMHRFINKKFQRKIVNIFLPIIFSICFGGSKRRFF